MCVSVSYVSMHVMWTVWAGGVAGICHISNDGGKEFSGSKFNVSPGNPIVAGPSSLHAYMYIHTYVHTCIFV